MQSTLRTWGAAFTGDLVFLALAAPLLYFPARFPDGAAWLGVLLLAAGWLWRRWRTGRWWQGTPGDVALLLLFGVMLPVAVWAAPAPLRTEYALPRAWVLLWNLQFFAVVVLYVSQERRLLKPMLAIFIGIALLFALVAPLGADWLYKLPGAQAVLSRLPSLLGGLSREGGRGFHPNIVAGALLYVLPLLIALTVAGRQHRDWRFWALATATSYMLGVFVLLQSRGGYIGLAVALLAMPALHKRWGRWLLAAGAGAVLIIAVVWGGPLLELVADNPTIESVGGTATLANFRGEVWSAALLAMQDFPFTGVGLGSFEAVARLLYPLNVTPIYYFGHAHNFWLQGAMDVGIPGLIALLALYLVVIVQVVRLWRAPATPAIPGLVTGLAGALIAQSIYSLTDAIALGGTANLLFWGLFGLIFALGNVAIGGVDSKTSQ